MFSVGSKIKMTNHFAAWCKTENSLPNSSTFLKVWVSWIDKILDIISMEPNSYDPNFFDTIVRPEYTDEDPLIISLHKDDFSFCNDRTLIPFALANGIKLSNSNEDCCKKCGAPGKVVRMACICSKCGQLVWGI